MTEIVFVKTRYHYDSYMDFWKLVELSEFPTCYVDEVDISKDVAYIVTPMNGEWRPHIDNQHKANRHNCHLVLWLLERPSGAGGMQGYSRSNRELMYQRHVDEIWVSDRRLATETGFSFVVFGSDYELGIPGDSKRFDMVHMSYINGRRETIYRQFPSDKVAPNCWPPHRDGVLQLSKFALNIHQDDYPFQEPLRLALFAAYGIPILTETITDSYPWSEEFCVYNSYHGIVDKLKQMLENDYGRWREMGLHARDRMCGSFNFGRIVRERIG